MTTWMILTKAKNRVNGEIVVSDPAGSSTSYKNAILHKAPANRLFNFDRMLSTQGTSNAGCLDTDKFDVEPDTSALDGVAQENDVDTECCDDDPILDHCLHALLDMFDEIKDVMQMRGLMANSRPEGLIDAIRHSVKFVHIEIPDESETSDIDEMEPNLLDVNFV